MAKLKLVPPTAFIRARRPRLKDCRVENPKYWVMLFPANKEPVIVDFEPTPNSGGQVIGTCYEHGTAERIRRLWIDQRDTHHERTVNALWAVALGLLINAVLIGNTLG